MSSLLRTAAALAFSVLLAPLAHAQHIVGGGDPVMMIFAEARYDAIRMLEHLTETGLPPGLDPDITEFLQRRIPYAGQLTPQMTAMAAELRKATLLWQATDPVPEKCAAIELSPADQPNVYLSLPTCRALLIASQAGGAEAVRLLVHESVHRFGYSTSGHDEDFASRVGVVVFNVWQNQRKAVAAHWADSPMTGAPSPRAAASGVWTGSGEDHLIHNQLIVWGGCNVRTIPGSQACSQYPASGSRLLYTKSGSLGESPRTEWLPMDQSTAPVGRKFHTAIWTGDTKTPALADKMIVFGGCRGEGTACDQTFAVTACDASDGCDEARKDNAIYDTAADKWLPISAEGAPSPRVQHSAVWTNADEMIVWGGLEGFQNPAPDRALGDGGVLSFTAEEPEGIWRPLAKTLNSPTPRFGHTALWTGTEMLVWGGCSQTGSNVNRCPAPLNDGAFFDPRAALRGTSDPWRKMRPAPASLAGRVHHSAIWTGRYLLIWGGENNGSILSDGAIYDSVTNDWADLSGNLPPDELGRRDHAAFFEPLRGRMVVWGGATDAALSKFPSSTLIYDLGDKTWSKAATPADPLGRITNVAAWIEDSLFVWGGYNAQGGFLAQGGLFNP